MYGVDTFLGTHKIEITIMEKPCLIRSVNSALFWWVPNTFVTTMKYDFKK